MVLSKTNRNGREGWRKIDMVKRIRLHRTLHSNSHLITHCSHMKREDRNKYIRIHICDRIWEKGPYRIFKKNRVITTVGKSRL